MDNNRTTLINNLKETTSGYLKAPGKKYANVVLSEVIRKTLPKVVGGEQMLVSLYAEGHILPCKNCFAPTHLGDADVDCSNPAYCPKCGESHAPFSCSAAITRKCANPGHGGKNDKHASWECTLKHKCGLVCFSSPSGSDYCDAALGRYLNNKQLAVMIASQLKALLAPKPKNQKSKGSRKK